MPNPYNHTLAGEGLKVVLGNQHTHVIGICRSFPLRHTYSRIGTVAPEFIDTQEVVPVARGIHALVNQQVDDRISSFGMACLN